MRPNVAASAVAALVAADTCPTCGKRRGEVVVNVTSGNRRGFKAERIENRCACPPRSAAAAAMSTPPVSDEDVLAAHRAFFQRPDHLSDIPVADPTPDWMGAEWLGAIRRVLENDRRRVADAGRAS